MSTGIKRGVKEYTREQKYQQENKKLKRQIKQLRKQLDRIPWELYDNIRAVVEKHEAEEFAEQNLKKEEKLKQIWECHACKEDSLRIVIINRPDGTFYFRKCPSCGNRTKKLKKYSDDVEGVR